MVLAKKIIDYILNGIIAITVIGCMWVFSQVFLLASFRIPSDSMEPELVEGDFVAVWKPTLGARLFNLNATLRLEQTAIHRVPGISESKAGRCAGLQLSAPERLGQDRDAHFEVLCQTMHRTAGRHTFHQKRINFE